MKKAMEYTYTDGSTHHFGVPPQVLGEELERLASSAGDIKPETIVDAARNPGSPLHTMFDWNDTTAAHKHRLAQARQIVGSIEIAYTIQDDAPSQKVRAFVNVNRGNGDRSYNATVDAMADEEKRAIILNTAYGELLAFQKKYRNLTEFAEVYIAAEQVRLKLPKVPRRFKGREKDIAATL